MSGGVDSSVAAALLKEQGFEVIGFYILGWLGTPDFPCPWQKEEQDARKVADQLGIPFHTINLSKEYERDVIDRFFAGYQAGVTPNPDILCNREIKFKALWQKIRQFEPDYIATGHYAKTIQNPKAKNQNGGIFKPKDSNKDQTYFLWGIEKNILPKIIFPLGELTKPEVRALAKKYQLATATKKDSQGICFIGPLKVRQFLASRLRTLPGDVFLADGRRVASHNGVELYTIGQRLAAGSVDWTGDVPPLFVIAKDVQHNRLIVGSDAETMATELTAGQANWQGSKPLDFSCGKPQGEFAALAKIRYRQEDVPATITLSGDKLSVKFRAPVRAITPGQSIVFYSEKEQLLGGAIIESVKNQDETIKRLTPAQSPAQV